MRYMAMINFTRAFNLAWDRTAVILFQPFDLGKWFAIGFSAFLAGLLAGGNGFNGSYSQHTNTNTSWSYSYNSNLQHFNSAVSSALSSLQHGVMLSLVAMVFLLVLGMILLMYWLGARGQFMFLDNVVRNRGAISWPWRAYARQGNSLFGFYLLLLLALLLLLVPFFIAGFFLAMPYFQHHRWPEGDEWAGLVILGVVYLLVFAPLGAMIFLFREMGVPLMFRHGLLARAAFLETWKLVRLYPGSLFVFLLLRIALFIALAVTSVIVCCATCCIGALPYLGTVFLLPALIYIKSFTLDCLAQMGPYYDVWIVDVPAATPLTPPPPPG